MYLNGELIGERSAQSNRPGAGGLLGQALQRASEERALGEEKVLVVKVHDSKQRGGIFCPVRVLRAR